MKLAVYIQGRPVAMLESVGDFKSVLTYDSGVAAEDFVSLTMPVRTESWTWDDPLHPVFQMNLPEGYLLRVLEEKFGPHIGASPIVLLSVIGRNMVGRLQVAPPGADLVEPVRPLDVAELLQGDNSEAAFARLVREYATSGVSGVVPKFLGSQKAPRFSLHNKATLFTHRHIIKGSSKNLPYVALNEYLAMQVARQVVPTARAEISQDGQALIVHRFDVDEGGQPHYGLEDFCVLLGMRPAQKYETTWERIAKAVRAHVPGPRQREAFHHLAATILLTYALRNADCHAKNVALRYTSRADVHMAPVYDMLTTSVYQGSHDTPPAISFLGKKTWQPGRSLGKFLAAYFGIADREQAGLVEKISDAVSDTGPLVRRAMKQHPRFRDIGQRMLEAWSTGISELRSERAYALGGWTGGKAFQGLDPLPKLKAGKRILRGS